ncbi:hypothetical protein BDV23DRAFT_155716 [Aspergillus alliaceus]|uniref:Uncharacterized protein n=1 Tax=Petromyces alliaceus TaxID=209559 RepID=A0A5N7C7V6_PETAA|nr:hypothetical protein BDV23DRAFT_155716 [Aspergillus alliaceus]
MSRIRRKSPILPGRICFKFNILLDIPFSLTIGTIWYLAIIPEVQRSPICLNIHHLNQFP